MGIRIFDHGVNIITLFKRKPKYGNDLCMGYAS